MRMSEKSVVTRRSLLRSLMAAGLALPGSLMWNWWDTRMALSAPGDRFTITKKTGEQKQALEDLRDVLVENAGGPGTVLKAEAFGAITSKNLQSGLDALAGEGGGVLTINKPGTYPLEVQKANPYSDGHQTCLDIQSDYIHLRLGPGVILQLANGQQTDGGGPVDVIVFRDRTGITISGGPGARITGNTAGQPAWMGGYAQISNGVLIYGYSTTGNHRVSIRDLQLDDHFSNPVNIGAGGTNPGSRIQLENLICFDCGEGPQIINAEGVVCKNIEFRDDSNVAVGDGFELSTCDDCYVEDLRIKSHGAGSAIDLFASRDVVVNGFYINDWDIFFQAETGTRMAERIILTNGFVTGIRHRILFSLPAGKFIMGSVMIKDSANSYAQMHSSLGTGEVLFNDVQFDGCNQVQVGGDRVYIWNNVFVTNSTTRGINIQKHASGAATVVRWVGVHANNNTDEGIVVDGIGAAFKPTGLLSGCDFSGNNGPPDSPNIRAVNSGSLVGLEFKGCSPTLAPHRNHVGGHEALGDPGVNIATFGHPHKNQRLLIGGALAASRTIFDKSDSSGDNINLAGGENLVLNRDDRLYLEYDAANDEWYEISRSEISGGFSLF